MDQKKQKELIILLAGAVALGLLLFKTFGKKQPSFTQIQVTAAAPAAVIKTQAPAGMPQAAQKTSLVDYTGRANKDPFDNSIYAKLEEVQEEALAPFPYDSFVISAVIWGSKRPQAIINQKVMNVGESLGGGKIIKIDKQGVHVDYGGREVLLSIK